MIFPRTLRHFLIYKSCVCVCECVFVCVRRDNRLKIITGNLLLYLFHTGPATYRSDICLHLPLFSRVVTESVVYVNTIYLSTLLICFPSLPSAASTVPPVPRDWPNDPPWWLLGRGGTGKDKVNYLLPCLFLNDYVFFTVGGVISLKLESKVVIFRL